MLGLAETDGLAARGRRLKCQLRTNRIAAFESTISVYSHLKVVSSCYNSSELVESPALALPHIACQLK